MWAAITSVFNFIVLLLTNWAQKDKDQKEKNNDIIKEAKDAIVSRDPARVTSVFDKLRRR